ncbi:hypothetical protein ZOSMA_27G00680 [Zostera marina]|uniref:Uncharacterized protein n=1 Tax=Zostera marina TaxID=29655 RepID=A0A0K9PDH4_ZOSMR|nr:hypothetical protein ZOSMA_27G00680 [Zostera marina]
MDPEKEVVEESSDGGEKKVPSGHKAMTCTQCFDAVWFCYSPVHQLQQYYRRGEFDTCFGKWNALYSCLKLKTKSKAVSQSILEADESTKSHIWKFNTVEQASAQWTRYYWWHHHDRREDISRD